MEHRTRIFLSVDIVGSTAFKLGEGNKPNGTLPDDGRPEWLIQITKFYSSFSLRFRHAFDKAASDLEQDEKTSKPNLWKTIGDEIIFVATVKSVAHTAVIVTAFLNTLFDYRDQVKDIAIDVKGTGWLAAFPAPNNTISLENLSTTDHPAISSPEYENEADHSPIRFDFLGTDIDFGFRICHFSRTDLMALSPHLALVLAEAQIRSQFPAALVYGGRVSIKGIADDRPHPIFFIDTERSQSRRLVRSREDALTGKAKPDPEAIRDFIKAFFEDDDIETPFFPGDKEFTGTGNHPSIGAPLKASIDEIENEDRSRDKSQLDADSDGTSDLPPIVRDNLGIDPGEN